MVKEIILYITKESEFSSKAREFLQSRNIAFREVDVKGSPEAAEELMRVSGQYSVPVITIGEEVILGFDEQKVIRLLGI